MRLCLRINSHVFLALPIAVSCCAAHWPLTFLGRSRVSLWSRSWWRRKRNQNNSARCLLAPPVTWGHHRRLMLPLQSPHPQSLPPHHITTPLLKHWSVDINILSSKKKTPLHYFMIISKSVSKRTLFEFYHKVSKSKGGNFFKKL